MNSISVENIKTRSLPVLRRNRVRKTALFGSVVRGEATDRSDIDFLVELDPFVSLLDIISLKLELEDALHKQVDVVEYESLKPALRKQVLEEQVFIL